MEPFDFDNNDPDDIEDFALLDNFFDNSEDEFDNNGDNRDHNNFGCGTLVVLIGIVLLWSYCF